MLAGNDDVTLFVLARRFGAPVKGPGSLTIVTLPIQSAGVETESPRAQAVVPELPHSAVRFESVPLTPSSVMQGDGYADYAKPFR